MLDALSLKNTKIAFETLARMGREPADATLVLNRADTNIGITNADVERLLGRLPDILVPSDVAIPRAITHGRPIVEAEPRSGAARAYMQLAERFAGPGAGAAGAPAEPASAERRSLLRKAG
jgi:pilus assembly protein CpaE